MRFVKILLVVWFIAMILFLGLEYLGFGGQGIEPKIDSRSLAETRPLHAAASTPTTTPPVLVDTLQLFGPDTNGVEIDTTRLDSSIIYEAWPTTGGVFVSIGDSSMLILRGGTVIKNVKHFNNRDTLVMNAPGTYIWNHNGLGGCTHYDYLLKNTGSYLDSLPDTVRVYGVTVRDRH